MPSRLLTQFIRLKSAFKAALVVGLTALLTACGGGGSSSATSAPAPAPTPTPTPTVLMAPGAYEAEIKVNADTYTWVAMLLPTQQGNSTVTNFYGLYYKSVDPDLYSGTGMFSNVNTANFTRLSVYPNISGAVRTGTGALSYMGNGAVLAQLSFPATSSDVSKDLNVAASAPTNPTYSTSVNLNTVKGAWRGRWSYGFGAVEDLALNISAEGDISASQTFQQDCFLTKGKLAATTDGTKLLTFTLTIPDATLCSLRNQILNGAAFVTASPVAGKTQRLYIAGVTTDGRGISYRADR